MSTREISTYVIKALKAKQYDFVAANFASPDMISHTGNLEATIKAVEAVDKEIRKLKQTVLSLGGTLVITADHGNAEEMVNLETDEVDTQHSNYPVPFIIVGKQKYNLHKSGKLANVAPTVLDIMGVHKPDLMTATSLIKRK